MAVLHLCLCRNVIAALSTICSLCCGPADVDEQSKREIKDVLMQYDRTLLVADPRRCEPKKYVLLCATLVKLRHCA